MPLKTPKSKDAIVISLFAMDMVKTYVDKRYNYKPKERIISIEKSALTRAIKLGIKLSGVKN